MKMIKNLIRNMKNKMRLEKEADLKAGFDVAVHTGSLWLTHHGVAFQQIPGDTPTREVVDLLREARRSAVSFGSVKE